LFRFIEKWFQEEKWLQEENAATLANFLELQWGQVMGLDLPVCHEPLSSREYFVRYSLSNYWTQVPQQTFYGIALRDSRQATRDIRTEMR